MTANNLAKKDTTLVNVLYSVLLMGILLRLFHYLYDRSLWMDEVYLCSSLVRMNYTQLVSQALDYQQKAPIGFLLAVKLCLNLFGNTELTLRIIPLIAGIISLFLYAKVCRYFLKPAGQLLAVTIFALAPALIYHSVEIKQYSTECLATIIALHLFIKYKDKQEWRTKVYWGISGALLVWFSFSVIFILAGIAVGVSVYNLIKKDWKSFFVHVAPFSLWLISFGVNYMLFTHKHAESEWIVYWFKVYENFLPILPKSLHELSWYPRNFLQLMDYPLGLIWNTGTTPANFLLRILIFPFLPTLLLCTGIVMLFRLERKNFFVFIFSILFTLIASGIYLYPLLERFWVFLAPVFILFIAIGFDYYQNRIESYRHNVQIDQNAESDKITKNTTASVVLTQRTTAKYSVLIWIIFLLTISGPILQSIYYVIHPEKFYKHKKSFEREALVYVDHHLQKGDAVYNYWNNSPGYGVYKKIQQFKYQAIEGQDYRNLSVDLSDYNKHLQTDFLRFKGKNRIWVIYNTQILNNIGDKVDDPLWYYKNRLSPTENLVHELSKLGKPIKKSVYSDVTVELFELYPVNN